jgi:hypothetical protein
MRRRDFIKVTVGSAATWPVAARAQQSAMPVIGFVTGRSPEESTRLGAAFRKGLNETGYVDGHRVEIEDMRRREFIAVFGAARPSEPRRSVSPRSWSVRITTKVVECTISYFAAPRQAINRVQENLQHGQWDRPRGLAWVQRGSACWAGENSDR